MKVTLKIINKPLLQIRKWRPKGNKDLGLLAPPSCGATKVNAGHHKSYEKEP